MLYNLTNLTPEEVKLIWDAVAELPARSSRLLLNKLEAQIRLAEAGAKLQEGLQDGQAPTTARGNDDRPS